MYTYILSRSCSLVVSFDIDASFLPSPFNVTVSVNKNTLAQALTAKHP